MVNDVIDDENDAAVNRHDMVDHVIQDAKFIPWRDEKQLSASLTKVCSNSEWGNTFMTPL